MIKIFKLCCSASDIARCFLLITLLFTQNLFADTFYPDPPVWKIYDQMYGTNTPTIVNSIQDKDATCEAAARYWLTTGLNPARRATYDSIVDCKFNYPTRGGASGLTTTLNYHENDIWGNPEGFQRSVFIGAAVNIGSCPAGSHKDTNGNLPCICNNGSLFNAYTKSCQVTALPDFPTPPLTDKNPPDPSSCSVPGTDRPIKFTTGNKLLVNFDYLFNASNSLIFNRIFNSQLKGGIQIGVNWITNIQSQIAASFSITYSGTQAVVVRSNGLKLPFTNNGSAWVTVGDVNDTLTEFKLANGVRSGWAYEADASGEIETYNAYGKLLSVKNRSGLTQSMTYSDGSTPINIAPSPELLINTTDALGRALHFTYDSSGRISTMTNPAGGVYHYAYSADGNNNLISVTYPDSTVKQYLYEDPSHPNALTGVIDENNSRYMTYTYDANGRAVEEISPTFGTNVNHYQMNYNPGVSTTVTDPRGSVRTYNFTTILGVVKSTGQSQPAGSGCAASAAALTYDVNGNIATRTDFNGNKTTYVYDLARNTETSRTEGLTTADAATAATRTITTTWHATWRLPLTISEYAGSAATGTPLKTTTYTYDAKGNITSVTEADPVNNKTRSTTTTYTYSSAVPGLVLTKVVDGPRTDASDLTTYQYYPHDATCSASSAAPITDPITGVAPDNLGCRGQLMSVSNALNQTTTYDRYNHHGQVEQMADANGLVTTYSYDLRQRVLSHTVGTETTSYAYDYVGQLTTLTLPDGSTLNYTWDAAHRLTDITDSLSNRIHYTLDTEGNRTKEDIADPNNVLTKTLSRSYDALNRMQQLTGVE